MMPHTYSSTDAHDLETANYQSLFLVVVVLVFVSSTIIILIFCCSVAHAFTHRHIYHMQRVNRSHTTSKEPSTDRETGSLMTVVSANTKGSRFCTTIAVPKVSSQENIPSSNANEVCHDGTKSTAVDLISIARNSRLLYALPEENSNSCADDLSLSSQSSAIEDDVFIVVDQQGQRPFQSEHLSDTSNDYSNTDPLDLSQQHTTDSNTDHHHPLRQPGVQHYAPHRPQQTGNTSNVSSANTNSGDSQSNSNNTCCIHSNSIQSNSRQNRRPASLDWKSFYQQSSQSTKNWYSETLVANSTLEQTEKYGQPMRMCLAEVGIARLFPFCDSDKAKMAVIAKQTIVSHNAKCKITNPEPQHELSAI